MGHDGSLAIAYSLSQQRSLIQYLHLRSVTIDNEDIELLAASLQDYMYLLHLDLSHNRIEGQRGGAAIASIISRVTTKENGRTALKHLNLAYNNLGTSGFLAMNEEVLLVNGNIIETLNVSYNDITKIRFPGGNEPSTDKFYCVTKLILDGNVFKLTTYKSLSVLLARCSFMVHISLKKCQLEDLGL